MSAPGRSRPARHTGAWFLAATVVLTGVLFAFGWWRGAGVGPQLQVPMFYDDHYIYPRPWTQTQEAPGIPDPAPVAALFGANRLSQIFVSASHSLTLVEIWLAGPAGTEVEVSLTAPHGEIFGGTLQLDEAAGRFYRLSLPGLPGRGERYLLTLAAPQATPDQPVVARSVGGDRLGSSLSINEYRQPGNHELYTFGRGGVANLVEQLLPSVFRLRLQQYKPDIFKGNAFTYLLGGTVISTLLFFLLSLPKKQVAEADQSGIEGRVATFPRVSTLLAVLLLAFLVWQLGSGRLLIPPFVSATALKEQPAALAIAPAPDGQPRLVQDMSQTLWTATRKPEERFISTALIDGWPAIAVPGNSLLEYPLTVPFDSRLRLGMMARGDSSLRFSVQWGEDALSARDIAEGDSIAWLDVELQPWAGQAGSLVLRTESIDSESTGYWIMPQLLTTSGWLLPDPLPAGVDVQPAGQRFRDLVELAGYHVEATEGILAVTLYWRALAATDAQATVFVHLLDAEEQILAQHDGQPVANTYPLPLWQPGVIVADRRSLPLPPVAPATSYRLAVGLYDPVTGQRWPGRGPDGDPLPGDRAVLEATP